MFDLRTFNEMQYIPVKVEANRIAIPVKFETKKTIIIKIDNVIVEIIV